MTARCVTMAECAAHDGEEVEVVGTYLVWDPRPAPAAGRPPSRQVVIMFGGEEGPYLGAWGHDDHVRPLEELDRLDGRQVRAVGTFLLSMPPHPTDPPTAAAVSGPCIHPVVSVVPA